MTCIAALVDNGRIYMGGDSAGVGGHYVLEIRADVKVFQNGPCLMGFTTSFRMGQLLQHSFRVPERMSRQPAEHYMVTTFVDAVRRCLKKGGYQTTSDEVQTGGIFLVGYAGTLYRIEDDYQVARQRAGYDAVGCGGAVALGSLYSTPRIKPRRRIVLALEAAEQFSAGVRRPFVIRSIANKESC